MGSNPTKVKDFAFYLSTPFQGHMAELETERSAPILHTKPDDLVKSQTKLYKQNFLTSTYPCWGFQSWVFFYELVDGNCFFEKQFPSVCMRHCHQLFYRGQIPIAGTSHFPLHNLYVFSTRFFCFPFRHFMTLLKSSFFRHWLTVFCFFCWLFWGFLTLFPSLS